MAITTSRIQFSVDTQHAEHKSTPQFGMRYPDGSILWDSDEARDAATPAIYFKEVHERKNSAARDWIRLLESRARKANIDPSWYAEQHQLVARDVNIFTTEPRNVVRPPSDI